MIRQFRFRSFDSGGALGITHDFHTSVGTIVSINQMRAFVMRLSLVAFYTVRQYGNQELILMDGYSLLFCFLFREVYEVTRRHCIIRCKEKH